MPIESRIVPAERLVLTRSWGIVTFEELIANRDALLADPEFSRDYDELGIHAEAESFSLTGDQAATVGRLEIFSNQSILAHVATRDGLYGMLRMMGTYHELVNKNESSGVFRDEESAREWLAEMRGSRDANRPA